MNDDGRIAVIFIAYSELRFPQKELQKRGLNMERKLHRTETYYTCSHLDNAKAPYSYFNGEIYGIENIKPPVRLSFLLDISLDTNNYNGNNSVRLNGGMNLKYGINNAFTLDVVLIPDFYQTSNWSNPAEIKLSPPIDFVRRSCNSHRQGDFQLN
jgi:hypothetical protein